MTKLTFGGFEAMKLRRFQNKFGNLTCEECLTLALDSEDILKQLPPGDPAGAKFYSDREDLFEYARMLELQENQA